MTATMTVSKNNSDTEKGLKTEEVFNMKKAEDEKAIAESTVAEKTDAENTIAEKAAAGSPANPGGGAVTAQNESEEACPHCSGRHKKRSKEDQKKLLTRLRRVEGQIRGIEKMVENDGYCPDILIQVSAATSALNSFNKELLACHIRSCVVNDIREGKDETIDELCRVMQKLMK